MKIRRIFRTLIIMMVLISNIGCDQISKNIVRQNIDYGEQISLIDNFLTLTKTENTGAFLGLGSSLPEPLRMFLLTILPILTLGLAFIYLMRKNNLSNLSSAGIGFMIGGGVGNIYDRIVYGSVTDFMHIDFVIFRTGIFNMADVSIMIGGFLVLLEVYFQNTTTDYIAIDQNQ